MQAASKGSGADGQLRNADSAHLLLLVCQAVHARLQGTVHLGAWDWHSNLTFTKLGCLLSCTSLYSPLVLPQVTAARLGYWWVRPHGIQLQVTNACACGVSKLIEVGTDSSRAYSSCSAANGPADVLSLKQ